MSAISRDLSAASKVRSAGSGPELADGTEPQNFWSLLAKLATHTRNIARLQRLV